MIPADAIAAARAAPIEDEVERRGIKLRGGVERVGPCPVCGGTDRFSINARKQIWNCRGCCKGGDVIALVQHLDGISFSDAVGALIGGAVAPAQSPIDCMAARQRQAVWEAADRAVQDADEVQRIGAALAIWGEAQHPRGTPVEAYLARRGLTLPADAAGEAIRFHPACKFGLERVPCMVALVRDVRTNEPRAVHRTALTEAGGKFAVNGLDRMTLGPVGGGAVKLTDDADVTTCLGIGEGIESTLSLRLVREFGEAPVWALLSAGQVAVFPVLAGVESLWIAVDHDQAGIRAANAVAQRWRAAGREGFLVTPRAEHADLNDIARVA